MATPSRSSKSTRRRLIGAAVGVLLFFAAAVFVLWSELREHSLAELMAELRALSEG